MDDANATIIHPDTPLGGARYPFLDRIQSPWFIESLDLEGDLEADYLEDQACLRWVNDTHVVSLHMPGYDSSPRLNPLTE